VTVSVYTCYGLGFGVFAYCLAQGTAKWLVNAPIRYLGMVSFSAYLWHFVILGSLIAVAASGIDPLGLKSSPHGFAFFCGFFPFLVATTVLLSTITYRLVERPMISLGDRLLNKFGPRDRAVAMAG
jgi:peptidoglycan/LPS O-acetylase OafA/YrhL